jgi:hypothetical protein
MCPRYAFWQYLLFQFSPPEKVQYGGKARSTTDHDFSLRSTPIYVTLPRNVVARFLGGRMEGGGEGRREKSVPEGRRACGKRILRAYASGEGGMVYKWGWKEKEGRIPLPSTHLSCHTPFSHL